MSKFNKLTGALKKPPSEPSDPKSGIHESQKSGIHENEGSGKPENVTSPAESGTSVVVTDNPLQDPEIQRTGFHEIQKSGLVEPSVHSDLTPVPEDEIMKSGSPENVKGTLPDKLVGQADPLTPTGLPKQDQESQNSGFHENLKAPRVKYSTLIDPQLKKAVQMKALLDGRKDYEVIEDALRAYLALP